MPRRSTGGPVGLGTLADSVGEAADTIEDVYEPYLLQEGLLKRTPARPGRPPPRAYRHLGLVPPPDDGAARAVLSRARAGGYTRRDAAVREAMADVKVRLAPEDTLRSAASALRDARTGLAIVDVGPAAG